MKQVNEDEFFEAIGNQDVTLTVVGNYPYRTDFKYRDGQRVGYIQDIDIIGLSVSKYYLDS